MRLYRNSRIADPERLVCAGLFSLALHISLLFVVRYVQPVWTNLAGETRPLLVTLEKESAEAVKPVGIPQASQVSAGEAKIGVEDKRYIRKKKLVAVEHEPGERLAAAISKGYTSRKILAIDQPQQMKMAEPSESTPGFLVTNKPDHAAPESPENNAGASIPAPSVAQPVAAVAPAIEGLVGSEPIPGERHAGMLLAEPVQEKSASEKPGRGAEGPGPEMIEETKPDKAEGSKQAGAEEAKPAMRDEVMSARTEAAAEPGAQPAEGGKSVVFRAKSPDQVASIQPVLGIPLVRKIALDDEKEFQHGERRKTIRLREKDFRYAMYIEGLRLKLERIGSLNYPVAMTGESLSGTLSVIVSIRFDGNLEDFSIARPSSSQELSAGAEKIVRMSAPFSPLPESIRREVDVLNITFKWTFSKSRQSFD